MNELRGSSAMVIVAIALTAGTGWVAAPSARAADAVRPARDTRSDVWTDPNRTRTTTRAERRRSVIGFVVTRQPDPRVFYGTPSEVEAALLTEDGVGVPGQPVELLARREPSNPWRPVASGITDGRGEVALRATLQASAHLGLRHSANVNAAPDAAVQRVVVRKRISVEPARTRKRVGMSVIVRGDVTPAQPVGSTVVLQRRAGRAWSRLASGEMITRERYVIRWEPRHPGRYVLRVMKPGDRRLAAGTTPPWGQQVDPETAADIAKDILRDDDINLARVHVIGGGYLGSAHQNIRDVARGRRARRSCHGGTPCGSTRIDRRVLKAVREMGAGATLTVSEFVGGLHARRSAHYSGRAVDINWVNGRHVGSGARYDMVLKVCRKYGASRIFHPSHDPYGGHHNHVHCDWR